MYVERLTQQSIAPQPVPTYADPGHDELFIEDQSGRVRLVGDKIAAGGPLANKCVTGAVVGVFGAETPDGDLEVADLAFAGPPPPRALPHKVDPVDAPYVVLASGLAMGGSSTEHDMAYELLLDWVSGALGQRADAARISSLVLAGDSVQRESWAPRDAGVERAPKGTAPPASLASDLDPLLAELCATLDTVVLLPGANDPSSATLPQQPLLAGLLPRATAWPNLQRVTNPAWFALHGRTFLATAGQNVDDLVKYAVEDTSATPPALAMALATLAWSHVAPTAPDTLCTSRDSPRELSVPAQRPVCAACRAGRVRGGQPGALCHRDLCRRLRRRPAHGPRRARPVVCAHTRGGAAQHGDARAARRGAAYVVDTL